MEKKGFSDCYEGFVLRSFFLIIFLILAGPSHTQHICSKHQHAVYYPTAVSPAYSTLQNHYDVIYYDLLIEANDSSVGIAGDASVFFKLLESTDTIVFELKMDMSIDSVFLNDERVKDFQHANGLVKIVPENAVNTESLNNIRIVYKGEDRGGGFFSGLTNRRDFKYDSYVTYTLSEPFQASNWYPVKQNLHDKADSVRIRIVTDPDLMGGSNGLLTSVKELDDGRLMYTWESYYPIAYYLISIAIADYIDYSFYLQWPGEQDSMLIQNFIYDHPEILENEKERIDITADMLILYDSLYGEYPFKEEKYGHAMAPMGGGMEHQTMTTLQSFNFDLVAHELAHQWFGNNVTCGTWQDIWINEGFASYGEYLAREYLISEAYAIEWMANAHEIALNYRDESIYLTEEEAKEVAQIFNYAISYKKGAAILHMLRYEINDDSLFFTSFREFQEVFKDSVAIGDDYLQIVNQVTGDDYSWFFDQWYYGKGFPVIQATWRSRGDSTYISVYQGNNDDEEGVFKMHIDFRLTFSDGRDSIIRLLIDKPEQKFDLVTSGELMDVQIDPLRKNLMISSMFEYIPEGDLPKLSPNPFIDTVFIDFQNDIKEKSLYISSMNGQIVYEKDLGTSRSSELNLSGLPPGIYLMVINEGGKKNAVRIVKLQ